RCRIGIAFLDCDVVGGKSELGRGDLGVSRFVPLTLRLRSEPANASARGMDANFGGIEHGNAEDVAIARRPGANDFGEESNANAHQFARLPALERRLPSLLLLTQ